MIEILFSLFLITLMGALASLVSIMAHRQRQDEHKLQESMRAWDNDDPENIPRS